MRRKYNIITDEEFYCTQCGNKGIPIPRRRTFKREAGHLKNLFCIYCNKETNHVECIPNSKYTKEDFIIEFENKNFTKDGQRKLTYNELKGQYS